MVRYYLKLNQKNAFIWRIIHRDNLPWTLENGLYCGNSNVKASSWVNIGNRELIEKRASRQVPLPPHGSLNDYVPFYFTPFSPMMSMIHTGHGIQKYTNEEIVILVSSLNHIARHSWNFLFTDSHAYLKLANFYSDLKDLDKIDWQSLQSRNFRRDPEDPHKFERYQAEALIYGHLPLSGLIGIACYTENLKQEIEQHPQVSKLGLHVRVAEEWYF